MNINLQFAKIIVTETYFHEVKIDKKDIPFDKNKF